MEEGAGRVIDDPKILCFRVGNFVTFHYKSNGQGCDLNPVASKVCCLLRNFLGAFFQFQLRFNPIWTWGDGPQRVFAEYLKKI